MQNRIRDTVLLIVWFGLCPVRQSDALPAGNTATERVAAVSYQLWRKISDHSKRKKKLIFSRSVWGGELAVLVNSSVSVLVCNCKLLYDKKHFEREVT